MDFMSAARAVGVSGAAFFTVCPDELATRLLDAAKRYARFFEKELPYVGHRLMLEHIAKVCGFPNWHAFQTLCSKMTTDYAPPERGSRPHAPASLFEPLVPALPLLTYIDEDLPPDPEQRHGLESFGARLTEVLALPATAVMDVLAKMQDADHWRQLLERVPANSSSPLYVFDPECGRFTWSPACDALVQEMDALWQHYSDRPKKEQQRARRFIADIVQKRPDFMEGWLALGTIEELDGREDLVGPIFASAIKSADALIPPGFRGEISWAETDNRPYHRLLYNQMRWCIRHAELSAAIKLARRQLKLNPHDNLGVRIDLPLLLSVSKRYDSAAVAMRRLTKPGAFLDGHVLLVLSFCHLLAGDFPEGHRLFLRALFELPALRPLLVEQTLPDMHDDRWHRGVIPDFDTLWFHCEVVNMWRPDAHIESIYLTMLRHPEVKKAEQDAADLHRTSLAALRSTTWPRPTMEPWRNGATQLANELVARFGGQWQR
jgi:hypothetical protein